MSKQQQLNTEFSGVLFADIAALYPHSERQYDCTGISDIHYCQLGVLRAPSSSGAHAPSAGALQQSR